MSLTETLRSRGLMVEASDLEGIDMLSGCSFYCGFDPTAASLQVGNLVPLMAMAHVAKCSGLTPLALFGGATGAIGDPSGKGSERKLLDRLAIDENVAKQRAQFGAIYERLGLQVEFVNNYDWTQSLSTLEFLRDVGKHFPMTYMLSKDSVKARLHDEGISFTEFSYMLLQAYDFYYLYQNKNCRLQVGGSEQWGNITAGLELIRRKAAGEAYALTFPLLTDAQGKKLGKTESGTIWIDPGMTSPYRFHQYWMNIGDSEVIKCLNFLTLHEAKQIEELQLSLEHAPEKREAQRVLADTLCALVHGESASAAAKRGAQVLFGGSFEGLSQSELLEIFKDVPSSNIATDKLGALSIVDLFVETGLSKSKSEARRLITSGGAYLNNERVADAELKLSSFSAHNLLVLRSGKKSYHLVKRG